MARHTEGSDPAPPLGAFQQPDLSFAGFDLSDAAAAIAAAADVAFVLDKDDVIIDVAIGTAELAAAGFARWIGKRFRDTVTVESGPKVDALVGDALTGPRRWRQVNHPGTDDKDIPVEYSVIHVGDDGQRILAGRELTGVANLQQKLIASQQSMEREYARVRSAEARYRILFQLTSEAVVIVDGANERIVEANTAAAALFATPTAQLASTAFGNVFEASESARLQAALATVRATGSTEEIEMVSPGGVPLTLSISLFRQGARAFFLIRFQAAGEAQPSEGTQSLRLSAILDRLPEGFVVCDAQTRILSANAAFVELTQLSSIEQVRGEPLSRWLGRTGIDVDVLFSALRQNQVVRRFSTIMRGEHGSSEETDIAAVAVDTTAGEMCFGLAIRAVPAPKAGFTASLERSVEQLTELVGRVPLKDIVRETTDLIERLCIEAALRLTGDNRASAAEVLGLSRQSLYVKMRRYDLGGSGSDLTT